MTERGDAQRSVYLRTAFKYPLPRQLAHESRIPVVSTIKSLSLENYRDQLDTLSVICACVTARGPSPSISPILDANKKNLYKSRSREASE